MMTAHDLAASWEWEEEATGFCLGSRSRVVWETAQYGRGLKVRVSRLETTPDGKIRQVNRYIDPDTKVQLVGIGVHREKGEAK